MNLKQNMKKNIVFGFKTVAVDLAKLVKSFMRLIRITERKFRKKRKKLIMIKEGIRRNFRKKHFVSNNFNNKIAGASRHSPLTGQPLQYSTKQINALQIYYEVNNLEISPSEQDFKMPANVHPVQKKNSWMFSGALNTPDPSQARLCMFQQSNAATTTMEIDEIYVDDRYLWLHDL